MLPSLVAQELRRTLTDFLGTTFALTDDDVRAELERFLLDPDRGIFRGPFVRVRLPFRPAAPSWRSSLEWAPPGFVPHEHQARAFARLDSRQGRPLPTIVTTGTGSGKTESFLLPILDHCRRELATGHAGVKALVMYPMNALANDQARRMAELVAQNPELAGLRVGLYTGDQGAVREMDAEQVIDHRETLRQFPPDILLTNYKMLDFLLLRPEDGDIWAASRDSLQYLVLDEFHTYDGAQGTDVAMLLRRLGAALGVARPGRPLGHLTPVATSATLGDGETGREALLGFAAEVFGEELDADAVIGESRLSAQEWVAAQPPPAPAGDAEIPVLGVALAALGELRSRDAHPSHDDLATLAWALFSGQADRWLTDPRFERPGPVELGARLRHHPLTRRLLEVAARPLALDDLIEQVVPSWAGAVESGRAAARDLLSGFLALLSESRLSPIGAEGEPSSQVPLLQVEVQVWIREVRRMLRRVAPAAALHWESDTGLDGFDVHLPAVYCRHCGRSGWAAVRPPAGQALILTPATIWSTSVVDPGRVVALLHAPGEAAAADPALNLADNPVRWFVPRTAELVGRQPDDDEDAVPVLQPGDQDAARRQRCPACDLDDGIRFLGSRVATLASVILGHLFGSPDVEAGQKKTLMFTDSVQDAAHRAAFVESRAFALNQRALIATAIAGDDESSRQAMTLDEVGERMLHRALAGTPEERYAVLPPDLKQHPGFVRFWSDPHDDVETRARVKARLRFASVLEFGLNARTGRSLELTGTVTAEVRLGATRTLMRQLRAEVKQLRDIQLPLIETTVQWSAWVWGVLERMRMSGAIEHQWFETYLNEDGNRWSIWGGRNREGGMPAFPRGRPAPQYPVTSTPAGRDAFDVISSGRGWYADWTRRCMGVPAVDAPQLMRALLDLLVRRGVLAQRTTGSGATAWLIPADRILLTPAPLDAATMPVLRCSACAQKLPGGSELRSSMNGAPCLRDRCPGRYQPDRIGADYYRTLYSSRSVRRIVAAEHTGLLDGDVRARLESSFKNPVSPDAPNVLACTPTLELGIDIGDLSIVTLTSLPRSTAAYLQRVGRAGRKSGSALVVSVLPSRPLELHRLADPLSLIAGEIVPPACHLDAVEILRRQYLAFLIDTSARAGVGVPQRISQILGADLGEETWLGGLLAQARAEAPALVAQFLALFGDKITVESQAELREYAGVGSVGVPALEQAVRAAARQWAGERDERRRRINALSDEADRLNALGDVMDDETEHDRRRVRGELARARAAATEANKEYWISGLESAGLLPNYALLDDRTTLDVALWWTDEETGKSEVAESQYARGSRVALRELAPGAVFYVRGSMLHIDAVEVGTPGNSAIQQWRCCPSCGWSGPDTGPHPCPRCGNVKAADTGQLISVVPFRGASAYEPRDQVQAGDQHDERERIPFSIVTTVDVAPEAVHSAWRLKDYPFGVEFSRRADLRWFNLGPEHAGGRTRDLAGWSGAAPLFHVCRSCGVVPAAQRGPTGARRTAQEARHRGWCPQRKEFDPAGWADIALTHHLRTQVLRLLVPPVVMADDTLLVSFRAALMLGLRAVLGGDPDHIDVAVTVAGTPSAPRHVMVLHDLVPGGTGYLAQMSGPEHVRDLLDAALGLLVACPCRLEDVAACHRCLLAHVPPHEADLARRDRAVELIAALIEAWEPEPVASIGEISAGSHESALEIRFRHALKSWLGSRNVTLTESAEIGGDRWDFRLPATGGGNGTQDLSWTLRPQVLINGSQPDFVLTVAGRPTKIALFTDGKAFHSSVEHARLEDDAIKRRALRDAGYLVWAITHEDIDGFIAAEPSWDQLATLRPPAIGPQRWAGVTQQTGYLALARRLVAQTSGGAVAPEALSGDAMTLLVRVLQQPDPTAWRTAARAAALTLVGATGFEAASTADAALVAAAEAAGAPSLGLRSRSGHVMGAARQAAVRTTAHGAGVVLLRRAGQEPAVDVVLAVDDRMDVIGSPAQADAWRDWLALSNVVQLTADGPLSFDAVSVTEVAAARGTAPSILRDVLEAETDPSESHFESAVRELLMDVHPSCNHLVRRLTIVAAQEAVVGFETDDGLPVELAWPERRVAILHAPDADVLDWLTEHQWAAAVAEGDTEEAIAVLTTAGLIAVGPEQGGAEGVESSEETLKL